MHGRRPYYTGFHASNSGCYAQRGRREDLPTACMGKFWNQGYRSCGHSCMQGLWAALWLTVKRKSRENFLNNNILSMVRSKGGFQISNLYDCYNWDLFQLEMISYKMRII